MTPPPPSLEAMVERRDRLPQPKKERRAPPVSSPWLWLVVVLLTAAVTVFLMR